MLIHMPPSAHSCKICLGLSLTLLTLIFFCSLRSCRLHLSSSPALQLLHSFSLGVN